jgi:tRNA A-37 threonylcarbamoyl transferase component Bud32/uncharacterized protein YcfJ
MAVLLTCPQGHQWQTETAGTAPGVPVRDACPICGAMAQTLSGTETPPSLPADAATVAPPVGAPPTSGSEELYAFLAPAQAPDELGRLGGYRVLAVLGSGGMGVVFKGEDVHLRRLVALKAMLPGVATDPANRERFRREAQAAAAIEHDNIVPIYHVGEDRAIPFLVMPLLRGESLNERLQREPRLPAGDVLRIGRETAAGLAAAHERGLIHRDIKPANLWLETLPAEWEASGQRVKILDFGLARAVSANAQLTQSGMIVGTPAFMAPEQASGKVVDARCDLFSLGCVLYRAATGEFPFKGMDTISTLMAVAMEQPTPPRDLNPALPRALSDLILRLLAKTAAERPPSARALLTTLRALEKELAGEGEVVPLLEVERVTETTSGPAPVAVAIPVDYTIPVLEPVAEPVPVAKAVKGKPKRSERELLLERTGAVIGAILGAIVGGLLGLLLAHSVGVQAVPMSGAAGAVAGYLVGRFAAATYDGYLRAESARRRERKRRDQGN